MYKHLALALATVAALAGATGCAVIDRSPRSAALEAGAKWAILPVANHTETAQAGQRAEAMLEPLLRQRGVATVLRAPGTGSVDALLEGTDRKAQQDSTRWAAEQGVRYAVSGAVDEWRYKVGVDGEPAVGLVLQVTDLQSNAVVWSATGGKSGWSREALSAVAQKLMRDMLAELPVR